MAQAKQSAAPKLDPAARRVALIVAGALFLQNLDGAIINTAMPQIANSLAGRPIDTYIGITAYILSLGGVNSARRMEIRPLWRQAGLRNRDHHLHTGRAGLRPHHPPVAVRRRTRR